MKIQLAKLKAENKILVQKYKETGIGYMDVRAKHIAYCMLRGRTLEQIEPKLRDPKSWIHAAVRRDAARIVSEILNPKPPVTETKPVSMKETIWTKVQSFLS